MWVGHSCPTPLTLILLVLKGRRKSKFQKPAPKASDKSVRPMRIPANFKLSSHFLHFWFVLCLVLLAANQLQHPIEARKIPVLDHDFAFTLVVGAVATRS